MASYSVYRRNLQVQNNELKFKVSFVVFTVRTLGHQHHSKSVINFQDSRKQLEVWKYWAYVRVLLYINTFGMLINFIIINRFKAIVVQVYIIHVLHKSLHLVVDNAPQELKGPMNTCT